MRAGQFHVGEHLPHDIFDRAGKLLLRRGSRIDTDAQVDHLTAMGFFDPLAEEYVKSQRGLEEKVIPKGYMPEVKSGRAVSVFAELEAVSRGLEHLFADTQGACESIVQSMVQTIRLCCSLDTDASLAYLLAAKPLDHAVRHPVNVATLATVMLVRQKHDEARIASTAAAALTMNIAALDLHHELFYQTGSLTEEQRARLRWHPAAGAEILRKRGVADALWLDIVAQHHEAHDGTGYPKALTAGQILFEAELVSLADRYCAMIAERDQREAMVPSLAIKEIHARHGKSIDPALIGALIGTLGLYPPGAYVRLANGETAIVVHRLLDPKHPVVYALCPSNGTPYESPRKRLTATPAPHAIEHAVRREAVQIEIRPDQLWPPTISDQKVAT